MSKQKILKMIAGTIRKQGLEPKFYVVGGSDIYGFKSDQGSDIDVRGFHVAPSEDFFKLKKPQEQVIVNQDGITEGWENFDEIELVSYELRKFGTLVNKMNFNIIEWLFCGKQIVNSSPLQIDALKNEVLKQLPGCVPYHYLGMAKQNYYKFLNKDKENYRPEAKKFLYVIRGLFAAKNVYENKTIISDITKLTDSEIVKRLIVEKKRYEKVEIPEDLEKDARDLIFTLLEEIEKFEKTRPEDSFSEYLNEWMQAIRKENK